MEYIRDCGATPRARRRFYVAAGCAARTFACFARVNVSAAEHDDHRAAGLVHLLLQQRRDADGAGAFDHEPLLGVEPRDGGFDLLLGDDGEQVERVAADVERELVDVAGEAIGERDLVHDGHHFVRFERAGHRGAARALARR